MTLSTDSIFDPIAKGTLAVMDDQFKFIRYLDSGREELYRYKTDAGEQNNLVQSQPDVAKRMRGVLQEKLEEVNQRFSKKQ